ncbi:MAG: cytochrome c1 [Candidatus Neomarinimicrobiota bacterium]|jgi:ubiquinol-cytochrome c reductase cytochrome c1 subunit|nr:cytochrome c1 [Candidatus Neomarinimicrobiota bacterium]
MRIVTILLIFFLNFYASASENSGGNMPDHEWSFEGITGTFDKAALQRGFKVYREICSGCHSMRLLYYRDLIDIGFNEEEVKVIASDYTVVDGPNDEGEMFERDAKPSDHFVGPFANDQEARASNNGSLPPDLSVISKARVNGANHLYNLLLGYTEPPENFEVAEGMYYNKWMNGNQIAMAPPLDEGYVDYDDGTENTLPQLAEDLATFLVWSAEPELEARKKLGIKVILFFIIFGIVVYFTKRRLWRDVH